MSSSGLQYFYQPFHKRPRAPFHICLWNLAFVSGGCLLCSSLAQLEWDWWSRIPTWLVSLGAPKGFNMEAGCSWRPSSLLRTEEWAQNYRMKFRGLSCVLCPWQAWLPRFYFKVYLFLLYLSLHRYVHASSSSCEGLKRDLSPCSYNYRHLVEAQCESWKPKWHPLKK